MQLSARFKAYIFATICVAIWGSATVVIKATVTYVPPATFLMLRFWVSAIFIIPITIYLLRKVKINLERFKKIAIASFLGYILTLYLVFQGISKTSATEAGLITSFSPLLVVFLGFWFLKEKITKKEIEGMLIAFLGTTILIFAPFINGDSSMLMKGTFIGNIIFFLGVVSDAFYTVYVKKYISGDKIITPLIQICLGFILAAIIFTPLGIIEQYRIYENEAFLLRYSAEFRIIDMGNLRPCNVSNYDKGTYNAQYTCTQIGCRYQNADEYECIEKNSQEIQQSFGAYLLNNIRSYLSPPNLYGILYMAFFSGFLAYLFFQFVLKEIEASEATIFYYLQPVFAVPLAILFLNESFSYAFAIGVILIIIGVLHVELKRVKLKKLV